MTLQVRVTRDDPTPPYEQLRRQITDAVDAGLLQPGVRLPTVRQLAADLGIAPGTVMRTYSELEAAGYILTRRGAGTIVNRRPASDNPARRLDELAGDFLDRARLTGATPEQILAVVQNMLQH